MGGDTRAWAWRRGCCGIGGPGPGEPRRSPRSALVAPRPGGPESPARQGGAHGGAARRRVGLAAPSRPKRRSLRMGAQSARRWGLGSRIVAIRATARVSGSCRRSGALYNRSMDGCAVHATVEARGRGRNSSRPPPPSPCLAPSRPREAARLARESVLRERARTRRRSLNVPTGTARAFRVETAVQAPLRPPPPQRGHRWGMCGVRSPTFLNKSTPL